MIKNDYGHLKCPFYQERLENGSYVYFVPRNSNLKSATVYINKGTLNSSKVVSSTKIPEGAAYYLAHSILNKSLIQEFSKLGVMASVKVDYSYTIFSLTTLSEKNLFPCLSKLMNRISTPCITEKEVEEFREIDNARIIEEESNPISVTQKKVLENMYFTSSFAHPVYPSLEESKNLHASTLKKYQEFYYVPFRTTLFISVNEDPRKTFEKIKELRLPKALTIKEENPDGEEDYTKVKCEYEVLPSLDNHSYLSYGMKFACRHNIYDAYGESMFFAYEILTKMMFTANPMFLTGIADVKSDLIDCKFIQGGEDAAILLTFRTDSPKEVINFLNNYFTKLSKKLTSKFFDQIKAEYYAESMKILSSPHLVVDAFAHAYPNHISYTSIVAHTMRLSHTVIKKFLEDIRQFKRVACYSKKD